MKNYQNKPLVISGYTAGTPYEYLYPCLEESLKEFQLDYKIFPYENQGNWLKNCNVKPKIIRDAIRDNARPVVWIDCDAVVRGFPSIFYEKEILNYDFAYFSKNKERNKNTLLSGTLFVNNTKAASGIVEQWVEDAENNSRVYDQVLLEKLIEKNPQVMTWPLPFSYCKLYDVSCEG